MLRDTLKKLSELYEKTGVDWQLRVQHCLTEPTAPTVVIYPEGLNVTRYRIDASSIEEGIEKAVESVYQEVILGNSVRPVAPFTNPDDKKLISLLEFWKKGEKPDF